MILIIIILAIQKSDNRTDTYACHRWETVALKDQCKKIDEIKRFNNCR